MVSVVQIKALCIFLLLSIVAACSSPDRRSSSTEELDIYSALKNDEIEYHEEEKVITKQSPEYLINGVNELRALYFRKKYDEAYELSIRLLKLAPSLTEVYYWRARMAMDVSDFQQAYNMAEKGLSYVEDPAMEKELKRVKEMAQMGAQ